MNACTDTNCRYCGSADLRWVTSVLAIWDGLVLRCGACRQLSLIPTVTRQRR